ncbi:MAG: SecY-interacting protein [Glaciecola sp.]
MMGFSLVFEQFVNQYVAHSNASNEGLITHYEPDWLSPCIDTTANQFEAGEKIAWQPVKRQSAADLRNLEKALEIDIPDAFQQLFVTYYSHDLNALAKDGPLTLLQVWNDDDFERLQKNLIAHVLMKRRLKQPDTLFFALTDEDDIILSIDVATQKVVAERVGKLPHKTIASNITEFIQTLQAFPQLVTL